MMWQTAAAGLERGGGRHAAGLMPLGATPPRAPFDPHAPPPVPRLLPLGGAAAAGGTAGGCGPLSPRAVELSLQDTYIHMQEGSAPAHGPGAASAGASGGGGEVRGGWGDRHSWGEASLEPEPE
jgi:hypothetical protein